MQYNIQIMIDIRHGEEFWPWTSPMLLWQSSFNSSILWHSYQWEPVNLLDFIDPLSTKVTNDNFRESFKWRIKIIDCINILKSVED